MKFKIMSQKDAIEHSKKENINPCILISITDTNSENVSFSNNPNIKNILRLKFDDWDEEDSRYTYVCMSLEDANKILYFVNEYLEDVDEVIVHCGGGVSRSAGVAAALMLIYNGDDSPVFDNPKYSPNMRCYRMVLESEYHTYDEELAKQKEQHNLELWKTANIEDEQEL